jgi:hypothetical protein
LGGARLPQRPLIVVALEALVALGHLVGRRDLAGHQALAVPRRGKVQAWAPALVQAWERALAQVRAQAQVQALVRGQGWVLARVQAKAQAQARALAQAWARAPVQALAQVQALARGRAEAKVQELARALGRVQAQRAQIRSIPTIRNLRHFQTPHRRTLLCRTHCHTNSIYHLHSHH